MKTNYEPKEKFVERMNILLKDKEDVKKFFETAKTLPKKSIRINTLKITPKELIQRIKKYDWKITQIKDNPEIIRIESQLKPGEIGKTREHILGYYYVQEITSMMPILALQPKPNDIFLDLCASPGSKTTQAAALMENKGTIIANDLSIGRIAILSANLQRLSVTNTIVTRHPGTELFTKLIKLNFKFDKILVDAPCSGEGNCRISPRTFLEWSESLLKGLSRKQKKLIQAGFDLLNKDGEMIYSTCTHAPEENEEVVNHLLENNPNAEILPITNLPIKTREGITEWNNKPLNPSLKNAKRIYHHDNDMEGFFLCKIKKTSEETKKTGENSI
ncbi:RsmB/NOP family class I SAM-dependent RNA methyltransferase [archaeon]|jgi:NOL1/NOP2/sun family putative RNA methylase|nr:RsmB/NOP family class I SAM-dependent RNA methyltransferase [archaeon]MBT4241914.1 RsmB/NOP family class I SAM-dependent RNA methyltransferase [archaeon]MBT4418461.1 RsmB/NOP family class I SAM-dependent RNA methyltransferase [archaeon]